MPLELEIVTQPEKRATFWLVRNIDFEFGTESSATVMLAGYTDKADVDRNPPVMTVRHRMTPEEFSTWMGESYKVSIDAAEKWLMKYDPTSDPRPLPNQVMVDFRTAKQAEAKAI
jgi:hypothetical protein